mgnify:CR=1 FL=1
MARKTIQEQIKALEEKEKTINNNYKLKKKKKNAKHEHIVLLKLVVQWKVFLVDQ